MANFIESTASTNGTNTPNLGPEVLVSSGLAGPSTTTAQNGDSITTDTYSREAALKDRALKRAEKREKNHGLAMDLSKAGDALLELKDYAGACANYLHATRLWPSNDETYLKLTGAYLKCDLYSEATKAATRGLSFNPKSLEQRYLRGVARLEQQLLDAAKADFTTVLAHDPHHADAKSKLELTIQKAGSNSKPAETAAPVAHGLAVAVTAQSSESVASDLLETPSLPPFAVIDFEFPKYEDDKLEIASLSDSSEANHYGNGIPCRFYNHTGCVKGQRCEFSHAPDEKSVRDDLGRNVCIYYLLDACKFGIPKCVYSHSRQNLPTDGKAWWNDEKQRVKVKSVLEMAEAKAQEFKAKKDELKQEQKEKAKKAKAAKKKSAEKEKQKAATTADTEEKAGEARTAEEPTSETGDEKATKGKKKGAKEALRKRQMKKADSKNGDQGVADKQTENPSEGTVTPSGPPVEGASESKAEAAPQGEKKKSSGRKRVWKKRSKKEVAADATDAAQSDSASPAPAQPNEGGKEIPANKHEEN